jgi:hypothetical protein
LDAGRDQVLPRPYLTSGDPTFIRTNWLPPRIPRGAESLVACKREKVVATAVEAQRWLR